MAKPKDNAKRTVRKESGGKKGKGPVGSRTGGANVKGPVKGQRRDGGVPALEALSRVGGASLPVTSELAKLGSADGRNAAHQRLNLPVYGNYCGRGHDDPTGRTPPVDAVDAVCREHNMCYRRLGDFDERCDRALVESMPDAIAATPSAIGKNAGILALLYFSSVERNLGLGKALFKRS